MSSNWSNIPSLISSNKEHHQKLFASYNPYTGEGSIIERFKLHLDSDSFLLLPTFMRGEELIDELITDDITLSLYCTTKGLDYHKLCATISMLRIKYDFEFWAATCAKVQDKISKRSVPFILRPAQRKLLYAMLSLLEQGKPIRIILLKARQWGGSTLVQLFMAWVQLFHRASWHSVIVADVEDQARNIRKMYTHLEAEHPKQVFPIKFRPFEGSTKNREVVGRGCIVYISSMQKPDSIRSADVMMAHLSEVGLWKQTLGKRPEDVIQSIAGTIPSEPYSMIVIESTAKGIGNFFHRSWVDAVSNRSGYTPVFVSWWEIEIYSQPFIDDEQRDKFIASMNEIERSYFELGATLEGINWYRTKQHLDGLDKWRMACEYPSTPVEAFQSTGNRAHPSNHIERARAFCKPPLFVGDMHADALYGKEAIGSSLTFVPSNSGLLYLWAKPERGYSNRYVVSVDIGGRSDGADFSVISIIDRYYLTQDGVEECIGTWRGHLDQDLVIWRALQIARWFCEALLVVECNSLHDKRENTEGDHSVTILDEVKDFYTNIYFRTDPQRIIEGLPPKYGFHTNRATKSDLVTKFNRRLREQSYVERDSRALDEADWYEIRTDGSYGAVDGQHDDIYMSRAIGLLVSEQLDLPKPTPLRSSRSTTHPRTRTAASF